MITGQNGDLYDRYYVRLLEMRESVKILKQAVRDIPERADPARQEELPDQGSRGRGLLAGREPQGRARLLRGRRRFPTAYRYHVRSPSFINLTALEQMCLGHTVADVVGILGSLDIVLGEVDRVAGSSCQLPVASCQLPVASCQLPVASCQLPVASCQLPVASCQLPVASCQLPVASCQLPVASCQLPVASCQLPVASCQLPVASCQLPVASCQLPVASCQLPVASSL